MTNSTTVALFAVIFSLLTAGGCSSAPEPEPVAKQEPAQPPKPIAPDPEPAPPEEPTPVPKPAAAPAEGALGTPVWAGLKGNGWIMIQGLDGGSYENVCPSVMKNVQVALQAKGLYAGPISGVLDEATLNAIGEYQKANGLRVSGVPSPATRAAMGIPPRVPEQP